MTPEQIKAEEKAKKAKADAVQNAAEAALIKKEMEGCKDVDPVAEHAKFAADVAKKALPYEIVKSSWGAGVGEPTLQGLRPQTFYVFDQRCNVCFHYF